MASGTGRAVGVLVIALIVLGAIGVGGYLWFGKATKSPLPGQQRCVAKTDKHSVAIDLDQAHYASIISGIAVSRGLPARAATIALATVYQETGIRNLDYGDRDSVGLFQQRPSQGWGTVKQLMDPFYATNKFYDALIKIDGWEQGDINDIAQKVQISGHPDAYRQHEANARTLASVLTGHSPAGLSCLERKGSAGKAAALEKDLNRTFGRVSATVEGPVVTIKAKTATLAWAYGHYAIANSKAFGVVTVDVGDRRWQTDGATLPVWGGATPAANDRTVTITVRT